MLLAKMRTKSASPNVEVRMGIDDVVSRTCSDARNIEHTGQKVDREAVAARFLTESSKTSACPPA